MSRLLRCQVGDELPIVTLPPVSRLDLIKYAGASGDYNPIHTIDDEAKKAGLPAIIAHGMWTMGNLAKLFTPYHEEGFIQDYQIRFRGMVFLGDIITLKARLTDENETHSIFQVNAVNQNGVDVIKGMITFTKYKNKEES
ncbi:dehydratase [Metabacillus litoralis]|uniref:MaoC/PaaZ C-terminal domain-containing protein n=1 Tax=Metabacillus TaxID=2675233 RepID=UPI001B940F7C|nr:MaoC/PaaZ C-terminal domain-containing protein [Metabacillus litoralis]MCM3164029.1 dehydratase [Metabacillus litoralis]MCM3410519.1 dehydratase [Metabacillus litoralis]UHA58387.1 dehydratase [Metabacillus litoralis]